jgi:hypothetical protein
MDNVIVNQDIKENFVKRKHVLMIVITEAVALMENAYVIKDLMD